MSDDLKKMLAVTVKAARQRMQLTQEELASRINRTSESVSNLERGLHLPSIDTLADLARELGIPISEFFEEHGRLKVTPERAKLEAKLREIGRSLDDRDLRLAVRLLSVARATD